MKYLGYNVLDIFLINKHYYMSKKALKMVKKARKYGKLAYNKSKILAIAISIFCSFMFPHQSMAISTNIDNSDILTDQSEEPSPSKLNEYSINDLSDDNIENLDSSSPSFPVVKERQAIKKMIVSASAYNSEVAQTDSSPCITANGFDLCEHNEEDVIATNILPFGTKVKIPSIDPSRVFTVEDRMNARYQNHIDIWMRDKNDAIKFGRKTLEIEIY